MLLRKQKELSQAALGKAIGTSGDIIERNKRNIMTPSTELIMKIAGTLGVSIDYLVGKTSIESDRITLKGIEDIVTLSNANKSFIFRMIDTPCLLRKTDRLTQQNKKLKLRTVLTPG